MDYTKIDWSKSHNGVMLCDYNRTIELMPEVKGVIDELFDSNRLELPREDYAIDVKIHMLMPNMYPCIPNWHYDFMPRDENGERDSNSRSDLKMFMWLSGPPLTEYMVDGKPGHYKSAGVWHSFTQEDLHRGVMSDKHTWRCFIRVIPKSFIHSTTKNVGTLRRHTQVYLDSKKFTW